MGYYVSASNSTWTIKKENLDKAYEAMCKLNWKNELKRGGRYPTNPDDPKDKPHEGVWFAWMPWNYHETCKDAQDILQKLGFETDYDGDGNLVLGWYNNKAGNEDVFLKAIAPFSEGFIEWRGEDGYLWRDSVEDGIMISETGRVEYG